jgi:hypothetical protein
MSDGKLFQLRIWERPTDALQWRVPSVEVDQASGTRSPRTT